MVELLSDICDCGHERQAHSTANAMCINSECSCVKFRLPGTIRDGIKTMKEILCNCGHNSRAHNGVGSCVVCPNGGCWHFEQPDEFKLGTLVKDKTDGEVMTIIWTSSPYRKCIAVWHPIEGGVFVTRARTISWDDLERLSRPPTCCMVPEVDAVTLVLKGMEK